jgi:hypothetical protein
MTFDIFGIFGMTYGYEGVAGKLFAVVFVL